MSRSHSAWRPVKTKEQVSTSTSSNGTLFLSYTKPHQKKGFLEPVQVLLYLPYPIFQLALKPAKYSVFTNCRHSNPVVFTVLSTRKTLLSMQNKHLWLLLYPILNQKFSLHTIVDVSISDKSAVKFVGICLTN
jgi:hypothetical protein